MKHYLLFFPHIFWLVMSIILIEITYFKDLIDVLIFLAGSFIVFLYLEFKRNKLLNSEPVWIVSNKRIATFVTVNVLIGFVVGKILLVYIPILLILTNPFAEEIALDPTIAYILTGFFGIWILANSIIIKINSRRNLVLFSVSPLLIIVGTVLY